MRFVTDPKDKSIVNIEGIINLPVSIILNEDFPKAAREARSQREPLDRHYGPGFERIGRVCVGPAKFKRTNHTVWSNHQPSGMYLAFEVEWPKTPNGANYFEGFSILVLVTDKPAIGALVLVSTEGGFRLLTRESRGKFTDAVDFKAVNRHSFVVVGVVVTTSGWVFSRAKVRADGQLSNSPSAPSVPLYGTGGTAATDTRGSHPSHKPQ